MTHFRSLLTVLSGPKTVFYLFPFIMVFLVIGTLVQDYAFLFLGIFMKVSLGLLCFALLLKLMRTKKWTRHIAGTTLIHVGVIVLLFGGLLTSLYSKEWMIKLNVGQEISNKLPFSVKLISFSRKLHQGTSLPKSYKSHLEIRDKDKIFKTLIKMNEPLRYKGYTLYQSSFIEGENASVITVVHNRASFFPYIASLLILMGFLMHFFLRRPKKGGGKP